MRGVMMGAAYRLVATNLASYVSFIVPFEVCHFFDYSSFVPSIVKSFSTSQKNSYGVFYARSAHCASAVAVSTPVISGAKVSRVSDHSKPAGKTF